MLELISKINSHITNLNINHSFYKNQYLEINNLIECLKNNDYTSYLLLLNKISINTVMTGQLDLFKILCRNINENDLIEYPLITLCLGWTNCLTHNLDLVEKYINIVERSKDFENKEIHIEVLKAYYYTLYFKADMNYFKRCINLILQFKKDVKSDDILKSAIERILAGLYIVIEDWNNALESFLRSRNLGKSSGNLFVYISSSANYSNLLIFCGEFNKAQRICEETIQYIKDEFNIETPLLAYIYQPLAKIYYEHNVLKEALNYLEKSISFAEKIDNKFLQITSNLEISIIYAYEKNIKKSLEYLDKAELLICETPIYKDIFIEFNLLKLWNRHKKNDDISMFIEKYKSEREIKKSINDYKEIIYSIFLLKNNNLDKSIDILESLVNLKENYSDNIRNLNRFFYVDSLLLLSFIYKKKTNMPLAVSTLKKALKYGVEKGYLKTFINEYTNISDLLNEIKKENNEEINNFITKIIHEANSNESILSDREIEILKLLEIGLSNQDIAKDLIIALGTVKKYTNTIYQKLNVNNRTSAIQKAKEIGII